jgi:hypothetical protein
MVAGSCRREPAVTRGIAAARGALVGLSLLLAVAACGGGGLSEAERLWCVDHYSIVLDTMDILYPYHWEGNEEAKGEALPIFQQVERGDLGRHEANLLLTEIARRYWPLEYEEGCKASYESR